MGLIFIVGLIWVQVFVVDNAVVNDDCRGDLELGDNKVSS